MSKVLIIGAQNIDIFTKSYMDMVEGDSNPAKINLAFGGVGRNIAVNLKRLGHNVHFLTVFGDDVFSKYAQQSLLKLGVKTKESLFLNNANNSIYLGIMDKESNLHMGFNDMQIIEKLNPDYLKSKLDVILGFDTIIIDNNLNELSIDYLLSQVKEKTVVMDAVSAHKAYKLKKHLDKISILKLNQMELDELSKYSSSKKQLEELHLRGAKTILLTNQEKESILSQGKISISQKPEPLEKIENTSGAGDAFLCGYLHGFLLKKSEENRLKMANYAAGVTLSSADSISPQLSSDFLEKAFHE